MTKLYVVKQKYTTANVVIYSDISLFYYQKFFFWLNFAFRGMGKCIAKLRFLFYYGWAIDERQFAE